MTTKNPIWGTTFKQRLLRVALGVLDSPAQAEEIVQEAYLRLLECDYDSIKHPSLWLFTVTRNLAIDRARRLTREREVLLLLVFGLSYEEIAKISGQSTAACRQSASRALRKCFASRNSELQANKEPAEAYIFVLAIQDASMTPLVDNLRGLLTAKSSGISMIGSTSYKTDRPIKTGAVRQALVLTESGVQWALVRDGCVLCVMGSTVLQQESGLTAVTDNRLPAGTLS